MFLSLGMQTSDGLGCVLTRVYEVYCAENQARLSFTVCTIKPKIKHIFLLLIPGNHTLKQGRRGIIPSLSTQLPFVSPSPPPWENSPPPKKKLHCRHLNKRFLRLTALPPDKQKLGSPWPRPNLMYVGTSSILGYIPVPSLMQTGDSIISSLYLYIYCLCFQCNTVEIIL